MTAIPIPIGMNEIERIALTQRTSTTGLSPRIRLPTIIVAHVMPVAATAAAIQRNCARSTPAERRKRSTTEPSDVRRSTTRSTDASW